MWDTAVKGIGSSVGPWVDGVYGALIMVLGNSVFYLLKGDHRVSALQLYCCESKA